jgi:hypothetical protein
MAEQTTDNNIIRLKVITFASLIAAVGSLSFTISNIISNISNVEMEIKRLDERVTKTTGRNSADIKDIQKELKNENKRKGN